MVKKRYFPRSMFAKLLFSFTIILSLLIILLSYVLYHIFANDAMQSIARTNTKFLSQTSFSANYMNNSAINLLWTIYASNKTNVLMYEDGNDIDFIKAEMDRLTETARSNNFVHSIYIYNKKLNRFLSTGPETMNDGAHFYDQDIVRMMPDAVATLMPIPRVIKSRYSGDENVYTYFLYDMYSKKDGIEGAVILNVKSEYLQDMMAAINEKGALSSENTFVINDQSVIVSSMNKDFLQSAAERPIVNRINHSGSASGSFVEVSDNRKLLVTYVSSDLLQWKFIHTEPYEASLQSIRKIRSITIILLSIVLVAGFLLSFIVSNKLFAPFQKLLRKMMRSTDHADTAAHRMDEVSYLDSFFTKAYSVMQNSLASQKNEILKQYLLAPEQQSDLSAALGQRFKTSVQLEQSYVLIALKIDGYYPFVSRYVEKDQMLFRFSISNMAGEWAGRYYSCDTVDMGNDHVIVLLNIPENEPDRLTKDRLMDICREIQVWCRDNLKLSVSCSIGETARGHASIHQSYNEVISIAQYRFIFGHGCILTNESIGDQIQDSIYKIKSTDENLLNDALIHGRLDEAIEVYARIMEKVMKHSYDVMMSNVLFLIYYVYNMMVVMEGNSHDKYQFNFNQFIKEYYQIETIEELNALFRGMFKKVTDTVNSRKEKRSTVLAETIVGVIESNFADRNLCLDTVAEKLNFSKVYISKVFRETFDQSVADYILDYRIKKAVEGLQQSNKNLSELLDEIGVENKKYFYDLFKKKLGVSLKDYRLKFLSSSINSKETS